MISQYHIAGIDVLIDAPIALIDNDAFALYRVPAQQPEGRRYDMTVVPDETLPEVAGEVVFQDVMHRVIVNETGVFHQFRIPGTNYIAAWNWIRQDGLCELHIHPMAQWYFSNSVGCFNAIGYERVLYRHKQFLFHCSYVDTGDGAILFSAPSGGGKTTQAQLWEQFAGAEMVNGDRAALEDAEQGYLVHGLPIAGSSGVFTNRTLPLQAIFAVRKAPVNRVQRLSSQAAFQAVLSQLTLNTWNQLFVLDAVDFAMKLVEKIPVYLLQCTISEEAVRSAQSVLQERYDDDGK